MNEREPDANWRRADENEEEDKDEPDAAEGEDTALTGEPATAGCFNSSPRCCCCCWEVDKKADDEDGNFGCTPELEITGEEDSDEEAADTGRECADEVMEERCSPSLRRSAVPLLLPFSCDDEGGVELSEPRGEVCVERDASDGARDVVTADEDITDR